MLQSSRVLESNAANAYDGWSGRRVLLAPNWADRISWSERHIYVGFSQQAIQDSPIWTRTAPLTRHYEARLHDHYGRPPYWTRTEATDDLGHRSRADSEDSERTTERLGSS
jgi:hypothetical protein